MDKKTEALKLALEALVAAFQGKDKTGQVTDAITAIREALAEQPAPVPEAHKQQEPVLWLVNGVVQSSDIPKDYTGCLFTSPQPAQQPRYDLLHEYAITNRLDYNGLCRVVRAATEQPAQQQEPVAKPKLIGWRTENFLWETNDIKMAQNWEPNIGVLPIFEGDPNTQLTPQPSKPLTDEQKDAERYRWLRNPTSDVALVLDKRTKWVPPDDAVPGVGGFWEYEYRAGEELDLEIDRAIEAKLREKNNG